MILPILLAVTGSAFKTSNSLADIFPFILSVLLAGSGYLSRKKLRQLKRRARWQLVKEAFTSFFKKTNTGSPGPLKFWLMVLGAFILLWVLLSLLAAAVIVVAGLLSYAIIANKKPSY